VAAGSGIVSPVLLTAGHWVIDAAAQVRQLAGQQHRGGRRAAPAAHSTLPGQTSCPKAQLSVARAQRNGRLAAHRPSRTGGLCTGQEDSSRALYRLHADSEHIHKKTIFAMLSRFANETR